MCLLPSRTGLGLNEYHWLYLTNGLNPVFDEDLGVWTIDCVQVRGSMYYDHCMVAPDQWYIWCASYDSVLCGCQVRGSNLTFARVDGCHTSEYNYNTCKWKTWYGVFEFRTYWAESCESEQTIQGAPLLTTTPGILENHSSQSNLTIGSRDIY